MACCTGQTECNHIITIGYLKNFIGNNIQDANGNTVSVNNSDDTYCPTYAELTGGSLIPNFVDAGNGRWSKNVDGITINGSYGSSQSVKQEDLVMTYTRFESLTITATPSTNISECGGSSTMTYTYTLRKYIKSMDGSCTVSTNNSTNTDTSDSGDAAIVYTSNQSWATVSKPTITLAKNGTHDAPARNVTITGAIRFRGTSHSATATIGQKALTGSYKYWRSDSTQYYSYDRYSVSPWDFDCNGGTWYGTGYYTTHNWDVYRWQDSCGVNYNNDTVTRNDTYPQYSESYGSGTVGKIDCSTLSSDYSYTKYENYHGLSDYWRQECKSCSGCNDYTAYTYTDVTASCEDGSATVNYTYTAYTAHVDDAGNCTYTAGESTPGSYSVSWSCSATSSGDEHVTITGAPCCSTGTVYTYGVATIPCDSGTNVSASTTYTATTYHEDGTTTTETGTTGCTIPSVECNSGSERTLSTSCPFTVKQSGGCTCTAPCECTALTLASTTASVTVGSTTDVTFTAGCTTGHTVASSDNTVATATVGNGKVTITGVKAGTATITLSYTAGTTSCSSAITTTVADPTPTCTCDNFAISPTSLEWEASSTASKEVSITESGSCISGVQVSSSNSHFTASISGDKITVTPTAATSSSEETGTLTVSYKANGSDCTPSKTVSLRHKATTCETTSCTCYVVGPATLKTGTSIASGATTAEVEWSYTAITWTTASTCDVSSSTTTSTSSHTVTGIPTNNTCGSITRTGSFTWTGYKACDSSSACTNNDATVYWSVSQDRGKSPDDPECTGCDCTAANAAIGSYSETIPATGGTGYVSYTADCGTVSASTDFSRVTITSIDTVNKRIYFSMSANDTSNERYDYLNLWIEGLTTYCTYTKINQYGKPSCDCNSFSATADSTTFPQTGGTITVWKITHSCGTVEALSASCDSLITSVFPSSVSDGTEIKATANANSGENDVTCTVGYRFKPNESSSCTSGGTTVTLPGTGACDCDASNISIQGLSTNLPYSGGTELQIGTYTANCTTNLTFYADGLTNVTYSNGKIYANVPANTSFTSEESYQIKCKFGSTECDETDGVSQEKKPCNCTTANFQIDPTTMDRAYDDDNFYVQYTADCGSVSATVVSGSDWITGMTVNNDDVTFDITENTSTTSARTGSVKLFLVGNESCSASTTITQGKAPCNCTTANFNVDPTSFNVASGASSSVSNKFNWTADCGTVKVEVTSGSSWLSIDQNYISGKYRYFIVTANNTASARTGTIDVYLDGAYSATCRSVVTVTQAAGSTPCACGDFAITSAPYSATCISKASHSNETIATYSGLCGSITSITVSDSNGLFNGTPTTSSTNSIIANINANCGVERTATVTVNYNNGGTCTAKTFDVKQCAGGISSISANPTSLDCNGGTVTFTANTR